MSAPARLPELTHRETTVLEQLGRGKSNVEIAEALHLSESTVKTHLASILTKWEARDRLQVVVLAASAGLLTFE